MLTRFLFGSIYAALISLAPVMLIYHRSLNTFFWQQNWQTDIFYIGAALMGGLSAVKHLPDLKNFFGHGRKYNFQIFVSVFFFLYVACCALCQKLNFTQLPNQYISLAIWHSIGLLIVLLAMAIQSQIFRIEQIIHPIYFGWLLLLIGVAFLFSAWMPLLAVPGALIILKWRVNIQNKTAINTGNLDPKSSGTTSSF
jgi:hypothetical protein